MSKPRYGASYWLHRSGRSGSRWPRFRGRLTTDVAIIGGGLAGCAVAYTCAAAGIKVALLEAERIAEGATASGPGIVWPDPSVDFQTLAKLHGVRAARRIVRASRRAALDFVTTIKRLGVRCDLEPRVALHIALPPDSEKSLRRETQARREAGLDAGWLTSRRLRAAAALDAPGAITVTGAAQVDPYRACLGLARAAADRGALLFEGSAARRPRPGRKRVEIRTAGGVVDAQSVVVATGAAGIEFGPLRRHFTRAATYIVLTDPMPAAMRRSVGSRHAVLRDADSPRHAIGWTKDDRIIIAGANQSDPSARQRATILPQRTGQLMYELSRLYPDISGLQPAYGWDVPVAETPDGVAFIGPHRNYPRHLFALGLASNGLAYGFLAGRILLRALLDQREPGDELFAFARIL